MHTVTMDDVRAALLPRPRAAHKNDFGHLLIIAGSRGMAGAALIATAAALRSGVGLTTVACPQSLLPILQIAQPCAMCLPLPEEDGAIAEGAIPILADALAGKTALVIGCGLSLRACADVVRWALSSGLPAAVDADALNHIARDGSLRALLRPRHVITPHPGEAARLLGRSAHSCLEDARALHALGPVALLKGADSYIAGERDWVSGSGSVGMAKGGSGDALAGVLGALLAQGYPSETAAWMASEIHGRAGERAAERVGIVSMTPQDTVDALSDVFRELYGR